jgi:drug/metabolite transporter (DMT)-like permease
MTVSGDFSWQKDPLSTYENGPAVDHRVGVSSTSAAQSPPPQQPLRAAAWAAGSLLGFCTLALAVRQAAQYLPNTEMMWWRAALSLLILLPLARLSHGHWAAFHSRQPLLQLARSSVHFAAMLAWVYAVTLIPLVEVFALEFTAPLWVALLAPLFLGERLTAWRALAAAVGFAGALIVVWPWGSGLANWSPSWGSLLALGSALGFAANVLASKHLLKTDGPLTLLLWMNGTHLVIASTFMMDGFTPPPPAAWPWLGLLAVCALGAHYCLSRAVKLADAIFVAPLDFLRVPLIAIVGAALYGEGVTAAVFIGAALVLLGNTISLVGETRAKRRSERREG